jgi:SAM-dependent methyltransferase
MRSADATGAARTYDDLWTHVYGDMQDEGPAHRHLRRLLRDVLRPLDYGTAVDVGCGGGHNLPLLREARPGCRLAGVDISGRALEEARRRFPDGAFHELDVQREAPPGRFDLVFSCLLLEHLPDDAAALRHMRAMAGRHLVVASIAGDIDCYRSWEETVGHVRNYRRGELEARVEAAGFRCDEALYWGFPFYSPLARRLQERSGVGTGRFSLAARVAARALYVLYFLNSTRRGDIVIVRATAA